MPAFHAPPASPSILARLDDAIAVDKPAGWLVHPVGTDAPDLVTWLGADGPWAPVHRLDAGTSGPVWMARPAAVERWAARFRDHEVEKVYLTLVYGATRDHGTLRRPLQDGRRGRPLDAETRYRTLERFPADRPRWCLLEVRPVTGRKHQIRRHLQGVGHAVVGDDRYRPRGKPTVPAFPGRLWLHCASLAVPGMPVVTAPLPPELAAHLEVLRGSGRPAPSPADPGTADPA
ncbi:MAG: RluA family pseudouridine synthase [Myxococcales bacterium]|nr:RluA family pseudouridine synthase [Myxococcales bacterium]